MKKFVAFFAIMLTAGVAQATIDLTNSAFFISHGLTPDRDVTINGDTGFLAHYTGLNHPAALKKYCFVLRGSPYSQGYQAAALWPAATHEMLTLFMRRVALSEFESIGISPPPGSPAEDRLWQWIYSTALGYAKQTEPILPASLTDEFRGVADGVRAAGYTDVGYDDVLMLNQGLDGIFFILAELLGRVPDQKANAKAVASFKALVQKTPELKSAVEFRGDRVFIRGIQPDTIKPPRFGCNEFVIGGAATATGETFHGRDFMFNTADVYQKYVSVMIHLPTATGARAFASIAPPSFVGQTTGINIDGVSVGQDICQGAAYGTNVAFGCLLIARRVLEYSANVRDAVTVVRSSPRGVPWKFIVAGSVADPEYGCGAVLDAFANSPGYNGPNCLPAWQQNNLRREIALLGNGDMPVNGIMVRSAKWIMPQQFVGIGRTLQIPNPFFPDLPRWNIGIYFPDQIETDDNIVAAANHFIIPRARFSQFDPVVWALYGPTGALADSVWRYETMLYSILGHRGAIQYFGADPEIPAEGSAGWLIDFLNTSRCDYYHGGVVVEGHHAIMNNSTRTIKALFGHMSDPWVGADLAVFVKFFTP